jgi:hypothetical protein
MVPGFHHYGCLPSAVPIMLAALSKISSVVLRIMIARQLHRLLAIGGCYAFGAFLVGANAVHQQRKNYSTGTLTATGAMRVERSGLANMMHHTIAQTQSAFSAILLQRVLEGQALDHDGDLGR